MDTGTSGLNEKNSEENTKGKETKEKKQKEKKQKETKQKGTREKVKYSLLLKLLCIAIIPMTAIVSVTLIIASLKLKSEMKTDMYNELKGIVTSVNESLTEIDQAEYKEQNGKLMKGNYTLTDNFKLVDSIKERTGSEVSIFYGDKRLVTTVCDEEGKRTVGLKASPEVVKEVIDNKEDFEGVVEIGGSKYLGYYTPLKDNGKVIGMVFAGKSQKKINANVNNVVANLLLWGGVIFLISLISILVFTIKIIKKIKLMNNYLQCIAKGDLTQQFDQKILKDQSEIGQMGKSVQILNSSLIDIVSEIKNSADELNYSTVDISETSSLTHRTTEDVNKAIEEIAEGAMSQAEETQAATSNVITMGQKIDSMSSCVDTLTKNSNQMYKTGDEALNIVGKLSQSNTKTLEVVDKISQQTKNTYDSAQKIGQAVSLITSIADETNLLSLNASIEAARAGENGRGFAVVASEIQQLAEQSNQSAQEIQKIVETLLMDADKTVETMEDVRKIVNEQSDRLDETKSKFNDVSKGIHLSINNIEEINKEILVLTETRNSIVDTIQSLSAISEENAAGAQETTASMQELTNSIDHLSSDADKLKSLAESLNQNVAAFEIH